MTACRSTEEETQLLPYLEMFVLINLRCISDLLNWEIQKGEKTGPASFMLWFHPMNSLEVNPALSSIIGWKSLWTQAGSAMNGVFIDRCCYGEKENSMIGRKKVVTCRKLLAIYNLVKVWGKKPYFWPMWSALFSNLTINLLMYIVCL